MVTRRITVDEVRTAYARHPEVEPARDLLWLRFGDDAPFVAACALGILAIDIGFTPAGKPASLEILPRLNIDEGYAYGFVKGFNGDARPDRVPVPRLSLSAIHQGHADGHAVANAVFSEAAT